MNNKSESFNIDGVSVVFTPSMFGGQSAPHDHFELRSKNISETGYKSHFVPAHEVDNYREYAKALINALWIESDNQMQLF